MSAIFKINSTPATPLISRMDGGRYEKTPNGNVSKDDFPEKKPFWEGEDQADTPEDVYKEQEAPNPYTQPLFSFYGFGVSQMRIHLATVILLAILVLISLVKVFKG
ncbi:MAG TPA: hypothetical protein PK984_04400 [Paludibacteraceae bacterium]|nr:hypothetical protein [Paludibacteraceae bacterium]HOS37437.1 hypothetical protein [Paludibacteraceae bacterium]HPK20357.1 hypothetical protein [Paludibacteraceae bacterium]